MASCSTLNKRESFGGVNAKNINEINRKFFCEWCQLLLLYPWQLLCCGTLLCKWCFSNGLSNREPFVCPFCRTKQEKKEGLADRGATREMKTIDIVCYSCIWKGLYDNYLDHLQSEHADLKCSACPKRFFSVNSFEEHRQELCEERSIPCGLPNCADSVKWYDMRLHYLTRKHQENSISIFHKHKNRRGQQRQNKNLRSEHQNLQKSTTIGSSMYEIMLNDYLRTDSEMNETKANVEPSLSKLPELRKLALDNDNSTKELIETHNATQIKLDNMKKSHEGGGIQTLDTNSTTDLRCDLPTTTTFSITLSKFRTSQYGYIFQVRLCSTIVDQEEYVSLFLRLLNGEYYNLLPFPFVYDIHIVLWDQSNRKNHILVILKSDPTSPALHRPKSEMNDEYGIIKFCPLRYLTDPESDYVREGVFFLRIFIDFLNTGCSPFQLKENNQDTGMITD